MAGSAGLWSCHHRRKRLLRASKLQVASERRHRSLGVLVSAVRCTASLAGSGSADGQHAVRADLGVGDLVRDDRVVPRFGGDQLDEAALRGCQVEHLGAAMLGVARPQQVRAFLEHRIENCVPTTWKALARSGPAFSTQIRTRCPGSAVSGTTSYCRCLLYTSDAADEADSVD